MRRPLSVFLMCAAAASLAQAAGQTPPAPEAPPAPTAPATPPAPDVPPAPAQPAAAAQPATPPGTVVLAEPVLDPLVATDTKVGTGAEATAGSKVFVHYTGWLYKPMATRQRGRQFDSSLSRGAPLEFVLGTGRVIKGWDQGVMGMKVGGKRTLVIPSYLAYGKRGAPGGGIPPDADLIFDVELVNVK
ncbi:FKBP-type peptidyl-prolyl cis-trans isomerase [Massilia antarctica]|uniref:FKBP-type peptidyl-prolyl cis-trans isomerase n=1 Tax=Massilia antarctica TaxID=2765360 RepID=UPI0006BB837A|nr:FKBP-type peptidyl-prolyl cis-trans isomerase [Massilia sp. H27-R4]MCY0913377.1 FKBP-type peptidyl-prolyl cis-trans isomerase [Massilia sp. H27-R4]